MVNNFLIPAIVHFNLGSSKISIMDYNIELTIKNESKYISSLNVQGRDVYAISKGKNISIEKSNGEEHISISILKTPDKQFDDDIKKIEKSLAKTKENDSKKYTENILFSFANNNDQPFMHIRFQGYINTIRQEEDHKTGLKKIIAYIVIADPTTFDINTA